MLHIFELSPGNMGFGTYDPSSFPWANTVLQKFFVVEPRHLGFIVLICTAKFLTTALASIAPLSPATHGLRLRFVSRGAAIPRPCQPSPLLLTDQLVLKSTVLTRALTLLMEPTYPLQLLVGTLPTSARAFIRAVAVAFACVFLPIPFALASPFGLGNDTRSSCLGGLVPAIS